jgi:hypothetical protein
MILFERDVNLTIEVLYEKMKKAFYIKYYFKEGHIAKLWKLIKLKCVGILLFQNILKKKLGVRILHVYWSKLKA